MRPCEHAGMVTSIPDATAVSALGTLADGVVGSGAPSGTLRLDIAGIEIDWWIGADDDGGKERDES